MTQIKVAMFAIQILVTIDLVPTSPTPVTLMMEATYSSETSVLARAVRPHVPEDGIIRSLG